MISDFEERKVSAPRLDLLLCNSTAAPSYGLHTGLFVYFIVSLHRVVLVDDHDNVRALRERFRLRPV